MGYDTAVNMNTAYVEQTEPSFQYATYIGTQGERERERETFITLLTHNIKHVCKIMLCYVIKCVMN